MAQECPVPVRQGKKKPRLDRGFKLFAETGGVLFRDFWDQTDWRPSHPAIHYTEEFLFVKLTIRYLYITICYWSHYNRK